MTNPAVEAMAQAIAGAIGDGYENAFSDKSEWIAGRGERGGRFRDVNEPFQCDYDAAAQAALDALAEMGLVVVPSEPTEAMLWHGASAFDHPSLYMGGPSQAGRRKSEAIYSAMIAAAKD